MPLYKTGLNILNTHKPIEVELELNSFAGGENTIGEDQSLKNNEARLIQNWDNISLGGMVRSKGCNLSGKITYPYDSYDVLLIHFNGTDAATSYTAESGQTVTFAGTAQLDTDQKEFGASSLLLDGNSDYVTVPDATTWDFGTGNFTIDFWVRFNSKTGAQYFISQYADASNYWYVGKDASDKLIMRFRNGGSDKGFYITTSAVTLSNSVWYHFTFERVTTSAKIFVNGTSQALTETTAFSTNDVGTLAAVLKIGDCATLGYVNGWIDEVRISKGIARWTANFTSPTVAYSEIYDLPFDLLTQHIETTTTRLYGVIDGKLAYLSGTEMVLADSAAFTSGVQCSAISKGDKLWITNATDNLKYKTNSGTITVPTSVPPAARSRIYYHKFRLVAEGGDKTVYGSRAGVGYWTNATAWTESNDAWSIDLPDYTYGCVCGFPSGDYITVFTKYGSFLLSNFPNVVFNQILGGHGCSFPDTIAKGDEGVYLLSQYPSFGIYLWNGTQWTNLTINHDFINNIDLTKRMFGRYRNNKYYFIYNESGSGVTYPNRIKIYDALYGRWMTRTIASGLSDSMGYPCIAQYDNGELYFGSSVKSNLYQFETTATSDAGYAQYAIYTTKNFSSRDFSLAGGGEFTMEDVRLKLIKFVVEYYGMAGNFSVMWNADHGKRTGSQTINMTSTGDLLNTTFTVNSSYLSTPPPDAYTIRSFANSAVGRKFQFSIINSDTNVLPKIKRIKVYANVLEEA